MHNIILKTVTPIKNASITAEENGNNLVKFPPRGGGFLLPELMTTPKRYVSFYLEVLVEHSAVMLLRVYSKKDPEGAPAFYIRFGVMPNIRTRICLDLNWLNAEQLFPGNTPGQLKLVCHGRRVPREEIHHITFENSPNFAEIPARMSDIELLDEFPTEFPLPEKKLIDEMGQYKLKDWPQKVPTVDELVRRMHQARSLPAEYPFATWSKYGGDTTNQLKEGTGYFSSLKKDGKWSLVDPEGNAFFSAGPNCVVARSDCRIDDIEHFMDWLPDRDDPAYGGMYAEPKWKHAGSALRRNYLTFSFEQANLYRAFGKDWFEEWAEMMCRQLKQNGLNTLANWSEEKLLGKLPMPYVITMPEFPTTEQLIFRDFPDVLSDEYTKNAKDFAQFLLPTKEAPYMIGYFLRNEPQWAFVDDLIIGDEVLFNPNSSVCKTKLIQWLEEKYITPQELSKAWNKDIPSFAFLEKPIALVSQLSAQAKEDMREFSRRMLGSVDDRIVV